MTSSYEADRDEYWLLVDIIKVIQTSRVNDSFSDVIEDSGYPNLSNPRHALAWCCSIKSDDTDVMVIMRVLLYYLLSRKARDFHPTMFATPETHFHDSIAFKPQVQLLFLENRLEAHNANRRPLRTQISYRLMNVDPTTYTRQEMISLATKIRDTFVTPTIYSFEKGAIIGSYKDKENGYELRILGKDEPEIRSVISKVLSLNDLTLDDQYLTISESRRTYPTSTDEITILNESYAKPIQRPTATVHFVRAELKLFGMRHSKLLVCKAELVDSQSIHIF
jgi:hypothetical protein